MSLFLFHPAIATIEHVVDQASFDSSGSRGILKRLLLDHPSSNISDVPFSFLSLFLFPK